MLRSARFHACRNRSPMFCNGHGSVGPKTLAHLRARLRRLALGGKKSVAPHRDMDHCKSSCLQFCFCTVVSRRDARSSPECRRDVSLVVEVRRTHCETRNRSVDSGPARQSVKIGGEREWASQDLRGSCVCGRSQVCAVASIQLCGQRIVSATAQVRDCCSGASTLRAW